MHMADFRNSPFSGTLDVVATLRDRQIESAVEDLRRQDEVTVALRASLRNGVDINSLSEASGLTIREILARIERPLYLGEDTASLAGLR
jgi:hypothetical protein